MILLFLLVPSLSLIRKHFLQVVVRAGCAEEFNTVFASRFVAVATEQRAFPEVWAHHKCAAGVGVPMAVDTCVLDDSYLAGPLQVESWHLLLGRLLLGSVGLLSAALTFGPFRLRCHHLLFFAPASISFVREVVFDGRFGFLALFSHSLRVLRLECLLKFEVLAARGLLARLRLHPQPRTLSLRRDLLAQERKVGRKFWHWLRRSQVRNGRDRLQNHLFAIHFFNVEVQRLLLGRLGSSGRASIAAPALTFLQFGLQTVEVLQLVQRWLLGYFTGFFERRTLSFLLLRVALAGHGRLARPRRYYAV